MAKENEGERSEHRHVVTPRKGRRFSDFEVRDMWLALTLVVAHMKGMDVNPSLLASALSRVARYAGIAMDEAFNTEE